MKDRTKTPNAPELLAPAGSFEAFFAAMDAGADAVYTGLKDFSARAKAKNFTLSELQKITHYAQGEGRKLYVTLNTLVKEQELPQLVETLSVAENIFLGRPRVGGKMNLVGLTREGLLAALLSAGTPEKQAKMRTRQVWQWIYEKGVRQFDVSGDQKHNAPPLADRS